MALLYYWNYNRITVLLVVSSLKSWCSSVFHEFDTEVCTAEGHCTPRALLIAKMFSDKQRGKGTAVYVFTENWAGLSSVGQLRAHTDQPIFRKHLRTNWQTKPRKQYQAKRNRKTDFESCTGCKVIMFPWRFSCELRRANIDSCFYHVNFQVTDENGSKTKVRASSLFQNLFIFIVFVFGAILFLNFQAHSVHVWQLLESTARLSLKTSFKHCNRIPGTFRKI